MRGWIGGRMDENVYGGKLMAGRKDHKLIEQRFMDWYTEDRIDGWMDYQKDDKMSGCTDKCMDR